MNYLKSFLWTQVWFTLIVACEVLKWIAASRIAAQFGWLKGLIK